MYRWVDHTAEVELHIEAEAPEQVFQEALAALAELLAGEGGEPETHEIALEARDFASLLVEWLEELVFLADTARFVPERAEIDVRETSLQATVHGRRDEPRPIVKAVTYHGLAFDRRNGRWYARVVLDV